jgi:copper homeostasis protein
LPGLAAQGSTALAALVQQAQGRIAIMAGGGVRAKNLERLVAVTGVREVHSSASGCACSP